MATLVSDPLRWVFSRFAIDRLRAVRRPSVELVRRIEVLAFRDTCSMDELAERQLASRLRAEEQLAALVRQGLLTPEDMADQLRAFGADRAPDFAPSRRERPRRELHAQRIAWDTYLGAAVATGLLTEDSADLLERLRSPKPDSFRGAMAECLAVWLFAGKCRLRVEVGAAGRDRKRLEFLLSSGSDQTHVEVKAPESLIPHEADSWRGDDSAILVSALRRANRQFAPHSANLLVLVPDAKIPIYVEPRQLEAAFLGREVIVVPISKSPADRPRPAWTEFKPDGAFMKRRGKLQTDALGRSTAFTRVSAVVCVEEVAATEDDPPWMDHRVTLLLNPHADVPAPQGVVDQLMHCANAVQVPLQGD